MKRTYIKPFMESEEFVTNEYVAACYLVTCETANENFITHIKPVEDPLDFRPFPGGDGYTEGMYPNGIFYDNRNGEFKHEGHHYSDNELGSWANDQHLINYHEVTSAGILSDGRKYGPNAS